MSDHTQPDLFDFGDRYPHQPGYRRTETSKAAAETVKPTVTVMQRRIIGSLREAGPATADEMAARLGRDILYIRPRFSELKRRGLIVQTGETRPNSRSGLPADVCRALS
jgi:predicted ArsR family transcriptional regulator